MKLLVVDDEARHRKGMMNMIGVLRPHYQVFAAKNGNEALTLTEEVQPDIVLTDIRMPQMDGLEFLRRVAGLTPRPKVVFLSAYNSFDYAQSALRHGASDYLLKPVDPDKVEAVLKRIENERERETRAVGGAFLYAWLHGSYTAEELQAFTTARQIGGAGLALISEVTVAEGQTPPTPELFRERLQAALFGLARVPAITPALGGERSIRFIALVSISAEKLDKLRLSLSEFLPARLVQGESIRHGLGTWQGELAAEAPASFRHAETALEYTFYESWKGIVSYAEVAVRTSPVWTLDSEALYDTIVQQGETEAAAGCREAFVQLADGGRTRPAHVKDQAALLIMKLKSRTRNLIDPAASQRLSAMAASATGEIANFRELIALLDNFVHELCVAQLRLKRGRSEFAAEACTAYLQEHYAEDLTLESVSERYHFNPSYFSTLFKQHTGKTFSEFLTETRLAQAKHLLSDPACPLKIYQIAEQCGYRDAKYFCRLFRKTAGVSPERFRHAALARGKERASDEIS